ncbi:MAG TPA: aspartate aminotransferase family protein, partial [Bacteroidetes bacterium]|nr:aspartate aminotransferase family protein [Bacteroidota bacterium]
MTNSGSLFEVYQRFDFSIVHGDGTVVRDSRGTDYLDFYGGHAVISIGHNHPHWVQRLQTQMSSLSFYSNAVDLPIQEEFGHHLCTLSAKPNHRLFLCNSGAEANENAIKLASFHTKRQGILAFTGGFHGRTSLALAATDNPTIKAPINHSTPVHH